MAAFRARHNPGLRILVIGLFATAAIAQPDTNEHAGHAVMESGHAPGVVAGDHGVVVDFSLLDRNGRLVKDEDFRGRYVLLGFGFTHCQHICPLMALHMGRVVEAAPRETTGVFVSVDTERDSAAITDDYARHFGNSMLGLSGSAEQINSAAQNFKVSYVVTKTQIAYTVQHTANVFLIDPDGALVNVFNFSTKPDEILEYIK